MPLVQPAHQAGIRFLRLPASSEAGSFFPTPTYPHPVKQGTPPNLALAHELTFSDIADAAERIRGIAHRTPVMTSRALNKDLGLRVFIKCENFQRTGAFKFRGATNAICQVKPGGPGVLTYSSGNHAQAVACASALLGIRATIVMPKNAPGVKLKATRAYLEAGGIKGSEIVLYDPQTDIREEIGSKLALERGQDIIAPYDHPQVIAGQGTAAMELIEDAGELDALFVCCGGGGLLSGSALSARAMLPGCKVFGVEPELGDDANRSFRSHTLQTVLNPPTIADGARTPYLGQYTFAMMLTYVDDMLTVTDDELRSAMRFCFERMKIVAEPTGVLGLAGLIRSVREGRLQGARRIGVVLSGGNADPALFSKILAGD